jgi:hypothetical protein
MLYLLKCPSCGFETKKIGKTFPKVQCDKCATELKRAPKAQGGTSVMQVLDNGVMVKKLERYEQIEDLRSDHASIPERKDGEFV